MLSRLVEAATIGEEVRVPYHHRDVVSISLTVFDVGTHIEAMYGKRNVSANLGRKVGVKSKPLQVDTQHLKIRGVTDSQSVRGLASVRVYLWKFDNAHLFLTVLKPAWKQYIHTWKKEGIHVLTFCTEYSSTGCLLH